jgi:uncharacterized protein (DUF58 family)
MIAVTRRAVAAAFSLLVPAVILAAAVGAGWIYLFFAGLFPLVLADGCMTLLIRRPELRGESFSAAVGREHRLRIIVIRPATAGPAWPAGIRIRIPVPAGWRIIVREDIPNLMPGDSAEPDVRILCRQRGEFELTSAHVAVRSPLGLVERHLKYELRISATVLPELSEVKKYLRLERQIQRRSWGSGPSSFLNQQGEFESLREYQHGDDATKIDWSASTRLQQPLVKTYRPESSGWVTVVLDAGRWMSGVSGDLTHFDRAIHALVSLSGLVFGGGDYLRILVTADEVIEDRVFSPRRSDRQRFSRFVSALKTRDRDFALAAAVNELYRHAHRMTALIVIAQFMPAGTVGAYRDDLAPLARRSPVLLALLRDPALDIRSRRPVPVGDELLFAAASDIKAARDREIAELRRGGYRVLDIRSEGLTAAVISGFRAMRRLQLPANAEKYRD